MFKIYNYDFISILIIINFNFYRKQEEEFKWYVNKINKI